MEEEATISRIITELEETYDNNNHNQNKPTFISHSTLTDLQSLLDTNHLQTISHFFQSLSTPSLLSLLSSTMDSAPTNLSLSASNLYLSLLLSPNSPVLTLFTPIAFLSFLRSLRCSLKPSSPSGSHSIRQKNKKTKSKTMKKKKNKGSGRHARLAGDSDEDGEESESFDVKLLFSVFERLEAALRFIHLNRFPDCLKSLIQTLAEIPVMGLELDGAFLGTSYDRLTDLCSRVLIKLLDAEHGDQMSTAAEVLKALSPLILMVKSQARSFALGFVTKRMMVVVGVEKESEGVRKAVVNLPRYLAQKAPEKAEPRGLAVEAIVEIVRAMEFQDQIGFIEYVVKMTQGKASLRLLAVDLILMLMMSLRDPLGVDLDGDTKHHSWGLNCLQALIQRCSDSTAGIRGRALSNLAQLVGLLSGDERNRAVLKEALRDVEGGMNDILRKRCMDEKATVRKAALLLFTKLTALLGGCFDCVMLKTMGAACSDPLVSIRKAAISALSEAFRNFVDEIVTIEWLHSVPRSISDNESSIQEECENFFLELVLDRISRAGSASSPNNGSQVKEKGIEKEIEFLLPEGVLILLKEICNGEVMPWVKKICINLGKKKRLKPRIAFALQNIIKTSESLWLSQSKQIEHWTAPAGAWFLLSEVSAYLSKAVEWEFLYHHWQLLDKYGVGGEFMSPFAQGNVYEDGEDIESSSVAWAGDRVFLLQTISNVSVELPPEAAADLAYNLLKRIEDFNMHSTEVNAHVKALRTLCKRKALNTEEADTLVLKWVQQLVSQATQVLEKYLSEDSEANKDRTFFTPPKSGSQKGKRAVTKSRLLSAAVTAVYTIGSLVIVCPSVDKNTVIPTLHTIITSGNSDPKLNKFPGPTVSLKQTAPSLYVQAWLTMGKVCLADEKLAKRYIPLFVQELEKSECAALRNNLVVMMADFCVRYTALVDCYISKITRCLRDPCELLRRQTFILLSRLLQRDYVKWRGVLFLRFLLSLVDESEKIRRLADFLFGNILKVKAPLLAYNSFVEAIFVLNDCTAHNGHTSSKDSRTESQLFSIRGNDEGSRYKRMHIYVSLLKQMAPEHLLATFAKLCAEILAAASDGILNIEDVTGQSVLQDAFQILSCKEIRLPCSRGSASDVADMEEEGGDSAAAAKGRAITQAVRKGLIQNTMPIFIELKRLLESKNSPLTGSLMECLRILLKDYKNEIDDILVADKQLQKELIYDMQKYESNKAKSTAAEVVANMQKPSSFRSPVVSNVSSRTQEKVASAMADAVAEATARSVLREVNKGALTPSLGSLSVPKLKTVQGGNNAQSSRPVDVLESLRRRQSYSDDEN
ncbi:Cnd1 domain-containing protein [Cephalotus follicularis]|uniref:Cnd1 domain-containing protein n=1 Tax=Cephalotus follicularis TaxID=3775 RepID=A0A1Q3C3S3_CEPFO|nr:Cnd1 domain-containing protein [Cephalotus follicularis]